MTDPSSRDRFSRDRVLSAASGRLRAFNEAGVLGAAEVQAAQRVFRLNGSAAAHEAHGAAGAAGAAEADEADELVQLGIAMAIRALRAGSVCIDLTRADELVLDTDPQLDGEGADAAGLDWPAGATWWAALTASGLVDAADAPDSGAPLRRRGDLLYPARNFADEQVLRRWLEADAAPTTQDPTIDPGDRALRADLDALFDGSGLEVGESDQQRLAAAVASVGSRLVLAGGPGTGKTHTVARILAVLTAQHHRRSSEELRVALAAPTGKAAARLTESVAEAREELPAAWAGLLEPIAPATTLHTLLGANPRRGFTHTRENPLAYDVVVVDEMSMVPLHLMARLLEALPPTTRLICVGDPDQLVSVEAGAVMADITAARAPAGASASGSERLAALADPRHPFAEVTPPVVRLHRAFRFTPGIARVADAIRRGDAEATLAALATDRDDVTFSAVDPARLPHDPSGSSPLAAVRDRVVTHGRVLADAAGAGDHLTALARLEDHRLLCAHRDGPWGVSAWDARIRDWLTGVVPVGGGDWYPGLPLLNTRNQRDIGLTNGDAGVVVRTAHGLRAAFATGAGSRLLPSLVVDAAQPMYAMTIHKAQGSQFREVTVVLPPERSPLLTRELLYTAVSRAREHVHVIGTADAVRRAVERPANRASGLTR